MGLFNFKKKKKETAPSLATTGMPAAGALPETLSGMPPITTPIGPPGQPGSPPPTMPGAGAPPETTAPSTLDLNKEPEPNFDQMLEGLPPPPTDMPREPSSLTSEPEPKDPFAQAPGHAAQAKPAEHAEYPGPETEEGFNLPDFDDKDFNEFEKLKAEQERLKTEQDVAMRAQEEAMRRAQEEAEKATESEDSGLAAEPQEPEPEPEKTFDETGMRYLDIGRYLDVRNTIDKAGTLATNTRNAVGRHSITVKSKDDKYASLVKELNVLQDNLMFIDNKLFEGI